jgi:hypothetical protein
MVEAAVAPERESEREPDQESEPKPQEVEPEVVLTEDDLAAAIVATWLGTINKGVDSDVAVAGYLLKIMPPGVLGSPELAAKVAHSVARMVSEGLPDRKGVPPREEVSEPLDASIGEVVDLAWSRGWFGRTAFAREMSYRARFAAAAAKRLGAAMLRGDDKQPARERRAFDQHRDAQTHREKAWASLDAAVDRWGQMLSWNAIDDGKTTPECKAADGKNFLVYRPPSIGLPGIGPHGNCRCWAGAPNPGAMVI